MKGEATLTAIKKLAIVFVVFAVVGVVLPDVSPISADVAHAQSQGQRKTLLELLFGRNIFKKRDRQEVKRSSPAKRVTVGGGGRSSGSRVLSQNKVAAAKLAAAQQVEKDEDAAKILVVGDFMAGHLAAGLQSMFSENPGITIVERSVALSSLVRDDVHDWPARIGGIVEEVKPIAVVLLVGMNDRQMIRTGGKRIQKLTPEWQTQYDARTNALANNIRRQRVPLIWVGLPPVSRSSMNADYLKFNETYRATVERFGGLFVDVWDGFVDDQGRYVRSGPDVNGQIVSLRISDGINMTASGKIKLGFFVEKAIKKVTGFGKDSLVSALGNVGDFQFLGAPQYDPAGTGKTVVMALGNPNADGGEALEGGADILSDVSARESTSFQLVSRGVSAQPRDGRIDAAWGKPAFDLGQTETPEPYLANMRGMSFRSFRDPLPGIDASQESATPSN